MEVRRNTRTAPAFGRQTFAEAERTDFRPILQGAADLRAGLDAGRRQRQSFELQKRLLEESNALQQDLEERRLDPNTDPTQLALDADAAYTARVNAVTDEYRAEGFDPDLVDDFFMGMGRMRNQLSDTALTYQQAALRGRSVAQVGQMLDAGTRAVVNNRDQYEETLGAYEYAVSINPDLTEEERARAIEDGRTALRNAAADSWAMESPQDILAQLDPEGRWRQEREAPVTGSAASVVGTIKGAPQDAIRSAAEKLGVTPTELAAIASYESAGTLDPSITGGANGAYQGIFQFGPEERRKYGIDKNSSFEEQVDALVRFAGDRGYKPGMGWEKLYTTINAGNPNASVNAADQNGTQSTHYRNIADAHFEKARKFLGVNDDLVGGGERVPQAGDVVAVEPGVAVGAGGEFDTTRDLPAQPVELHPVLRDLTGPERLRLLERADAAAQKNSAKQKAALDVLIENYKTEMLENGEAGNPRPTDEEIFAGYGEVLAPQIIADLNSTEQLGKSLQTYAIMSPERIRADVERLRPVKGSPTFATENTLFQAAQKAEKQILDQRAADPAAYVLANFPAVGQAAEQGEASYYKAMDRALEQLGIDPATTSPLPAAARDQIISGWNQRTPSQKRQWFGDNFRTMGEERLAAFARGAEGTDMEQELKIYAFARTGATTATIDEIFAGRDALKKDPARRPSAEKVTAFFRESAFSAVTSMNADASAALQEAAAALYVQKGGSADPNKFSREIYDQSLKQALGGSLPYNDSKGVVKDFTILPPRVTPQRFESWVTGLRKGELTALSVNGLPPRYGDLKTEVMLKDIIEDGVFVMYAPGLYRIKMASDGGFLKTARGTNFTIRLKPEDVK